MSLIKNPKLALVDLKMSKLLKIQMYKPNLVIGDLILNAYTVGHVKGPLTIIAVSIIDFPLLPKNDKIWNH